MFIEKLFSKVDDEERACHYKEQSIKRKLAIHDVFWNGTIWQDYDLQTNTFCENPSSLYISSLSPLWHDSFIIDGGESTIKKIFTLYNQMLHDFPGGVPISLTVSGQQWDFPNIWAPIQHRIIQMYLEFYKKYQNPKYYQNALILAQKYISNTFCGYQKYGTIPIL